MKTVALRFSDNFAPAQGTIQAHEDIISEKGFVWYGKLGLPLSAKAVNYIMENQDPMILLIHSGKTARYWAHVTEICRNTPEIEAIPAYYRDKTNSFNSWFKITRFDKAQKDVLSKCCVISSGATLGEVSRRSMSPYFIIEAGGDAL